MKAIYETRGRAREYCELACNLFSGCTNRCFYYYVPGATRQEALNFHSDVQERPNIIEAVARDAAKLEAGARVFLCFSCDPFPHDKALCEITRSVIEILGSEGLVPRVLTKNGRGALDHMDVLHKWGAEVGATLTFVQESTAWRWEPGADGPRDRINLLKAMADQGLKTWASLEPVLNPADALWWLREWNDRHLVGEWRVGKLNHVERIDPEVIDELGLRDVDWAQFALDAVDALQKLGVPWRIKRDLAEYLPSDVPRRQ